jgi:hypothetical protein
MGYGKARTSGRNLAIAAMLAGLAAAPALAQSVPLPPARPPAVSATVTGSVTIPAKPASKPASRSRAQVTQTQQAPNPIFNPFASLMGKPGSTTALSPDQRAIIQRVDNYLSSTQILSGNFVQVGPDGRRSQGEFYIQKPGRVRFDYDPPSPIDIIADGQSVVVRDRKLATQDLYPLSQTPLRFLLADNVDLMKDTNPVAVYADDVFVTVVVEEKTAWSAPAG